MSSPYPAETNDGVVTSWVPLTTSWSSVFGCSNSFMLEGSRLVAFDPAYGLQIDTAVKCQPPAVTTWWNQALLGGGSGAGHTAVSILPLTCPEDFSTVVTSVKDQTSTLAMCCPPGYSLANGVPGSVAGDCLSNVLPGMVLTFASTSESNSDSWIIATTTLSTTSTVGAIAVVGWNVERAAAITTSSTSSSTTSSAISSTSATTAANSSQTPSIASPTSSATPAPGLSTGTKIGIGVGVALGAIGLIALIIAIWLLRRRKQKPVNEGNTDTDGKHLPISTDPASRIYGQNPSELDGRHLRLHPAELDASRYS